MLLKILGSNSKGNCYLFASKHEVLVLEAGVKFSEVKEALDFDISNVVGCCITHEHLDHAGHIKDFIKSGIPVYTSQGTIDAVSQKLNSDFGMNSIQAGRRSQIGKFGVMPFDILHDCNQPFGFLIHHEEMGLCAFITDTHYIPNTFKGLNQILIEANYEERILKENLIDGKIDNMRYQRVIRSHMSLETCVEALKKNDLKGVQNIVLIHLSPQNSDAKLFKSRVVEATGKNVHIALKGLVIDFNKNPY